MYRTYQLTANETGKIWRRRWDGDTYYFDVYDSPEELEAESERLRKIAEEAEKERAEYIKWLEEQERRERQFNVKVKEGYEVLSLVWDGSVNHAIIDRHTECEPYVVCFNYDVNDGSWGAGHYFNNYKDAVRHLGKSIR